MRKFIAYNRHLVVGEDEAIILQLQKMQLVNRDADIHEFMMGFSNRAWVTFGQNISDNSPCDFIKDLIEYGYLEEIKDN